MIIFLVTRQNITDEPICSTINWIKSIVTIEWVCIFNFFYFLFLAWANLSVPLVFVKAGHQLIIINLNSLTLLRVEFLHILMRILRIHRILIVLLLLHLIFPSAVFCHDWGTWDLHVVDNEFVCEEGVLLVLAGEVFYWNQHFSDLLEDIVLFVDSFVNYHLIGFIWSKK